MRIELRPFARDDFPILIGWIPSARFLMQWAGPTFHWPLDNVQLESRWLQAQGPEPRLLAFTAVSAEGGEPVGHIELAAIDRENGSASIACVLVGAAESRGRGIGTEMVRQTVDVGFHRLGLHRIQLHVFDFNEAAIACYERCGFRREGLLKEARRVDGGYWSLYVMGILESDWRSRGNH